MSLVSLANSRKSQAVKNAIDKSLREIGFEFSKDIRNVVIKPNMCYYWDYSTGETTDPRFVEALVNVIRNHTSPRVNISVVEADASAMKCRYAFKFLGYEKMARKIGVDLVNLSEEKSERVTVSVADHVYHFRVPQRIREADLRINVPKIKYHTFTKISCALKNIYGINPYPKKFRYHPRINQVIVALNKIMKFDICVVDGGIVMGSQPRNLGLVMAGVDPVAVDAVAARLARINPKTVKHIQLAQKEGLGSMSYVTRETDFEYFKKNFPRISPKSEIIQLGLKLVTRLGLNNRLGV